MKKNKITTLIILALLTVVSAIMFVSCSNDADPPASYSFSIKNQVENVSLESPYTIPVEVDGFNQESLSWSSSDSSVVTVERGVVVGKKLGSATITATFGNKSDSCVVNVTLGDYVPTLENNVGKEIRIVQGSVFDITFGVSYNQKDYQDVTLDIDGDNLGEYFDYDIVANILTITPKKSGEVSFNITGSWRVANGVNIPTLVNNIKLNIVDDIYFTVNDQAMSTIEVYTVENFAGTPFQNKVDCSFQVIKNGQKVDDAKILVSVEDTNLAEYVNGQIVGKNRGTTKINLTYTQGNETYSDYCTLNVLPPEVVVDEIATYSIEDQSLCMGEEELDIDNIVQIEINGRTFDINGEMPTISLNNVSTANVGQIRTEERLKVTVEGVDYYITRAMKEKEFSSMVFAVLMDDGAVYKLNNVKLYSKLIKTASDLESVLGGDNIKLVDDGYYALANNINAKSVKFVGNNKKDNKSKSRFIGIFDGKGYSIFNADVSATSPLIWGSTYGSQDGGLFGINIDSSAAIRNLGLINLKAVGTSILSDVVTRNAGPGGGYPVPVIENIYVEMAKDSYNIVGLSIDMNAYIQNVIIKYDKEEAVNQAGTFWRPSSFLREGGYGGIKDCYSISKTKGSYTAVDGNIVEMVFEGLLCYDTVDAMKQANHSYAKFNDCWTVETGEIPVWKNNVDESSDMTARSYDISSKTLDLTGLPFTMQDVVSVKVGTSAPVSVVNGVMPEIILQNVSTANVGQIRTEERLKITVNGTDMYVSRSMTDKEFSSISFLLTLKNGETFELSNVNVYTKVIKTPADLQSAFGSDKVMNGKYDDGYYVLANNIDATNVNFKNSAKVNSAGNKFRGILDGKGYSIFNADLSATNPKIWGVTAGTEDGGLIGMGIDSSAAVRNLGLINVKAVGTSILSDAIYRNAGPGGGYPVPVIENMYIEVSKDNQNLLALSIDAAGAYFQNIIVKYNKHETISQNGTYFRTNNAFYQEGGVGSISNSYSISLTRAAGYLQDDVWIDCNFEGLTCYDNAQAMKEANNDYSSFNDLWTVETGEIPVWKNLILS